MPRMETPPSLPQGEERLTEAGWGGSFQSGKEPSCRTDALVCPPEIPCVIVDHVPLCGQTRASVPTGGTSLM